MELRRLQVEDITPAYVGWLSDPEVTRYLETRHSAQTEESVRQFVARMAQADDEFLFGIFLPEGRHIGNIKVGPIRRYHRLADVSLLIGEADCRGRGYAAEAIAGVSRFAFAELPVEKLSASMYAPNQASAKAFIRAGFRQEGLRIGHYDLDGKRCDLIELGALPEDLSRAEKGAA
ncbi:GNAT family N-acetyltransferase [Devosia sediminis]|uniref:GNAT family N-acetyltransferase n=1 Tax=Devosia sediminis TaxID=2798801 RepID=A0A934IXW6_9HYPH|nr:GNAT family N-acetyltransferase [Devosia sediminis]MBJ3785065.1 GNAT family N-acetyltransferase [Devosia sediminis]